MKLFKTRKGILSLFLLVMGFRAVARLKPFLDRIREQPSADPASVFALDPVLVPEPAPAPVPAEARNPWPTSHASTWTVGPQRTVPEVRRTEIKRPAGVDAATQRRITNQRVGALCSFAVVFSFASSAIAGAHALPIARVITDGF